MVCRVHFLKKSTPTQFYTSHTTICPLHITLAAHKFGIPKYASDSMDVITDPEIDAVWICSPSQYHADQIKACAKHGKHVFCEKPIATDLMETIEAIDACSAAGVKLMIGLQRRFDANFLRVKQSIDEKEIGDAFMVRCCHCAMGC